MLARIRQFIPPALILALAAPTTAAQVAVFGQTWPFTACTTVVSDPATGAIYAGFGSGVVVLQDSGTPPNPLLMPSVANMLRPGGLVKDLALTSEHLYIAAHRGGLVRNKRASADPAPEWTLDSPTVKDTWAVTVPLRVGDFDLVFAGTNDGGTGGRVVLLWADAIADPVPAPVVKASYDVGGPVYSLASMVQLDGTVTLLVGAQCGDYTTTPVPPNPPATIMASLFRFDFPGGASTLPQSFLEPSAVWTDVVEPTGELPEAVPTFIRDIVIDSQASAAYVAAFTRGLRKFDLSGGGLLEVVAGNWPILTGPQSSPARFDALSFHRSGLGTFLAVALGPPFADEQQVSGVCTQQFACDDAVAGEDRGAWKGAVLYDVSQPSAEKEAEIPVSGCGGPSCLPGPPLGVAIRPVGSSLRLDAACTTGGLSVVTASPPGFALQAFPGWDEADGFPTSTFDDLVQIDHWLVAAYEIGVVLFDLLDAPLLSEPVSLNSVSGGVVLSGFAAEGGVPAMVFGSAQALGVAYYQLKPATIPPSLDFLGYGGIPHGSAGRIYAMQALPPSRSPDLTTPWLITVTGVEPDTVSTGCGLLAGSGVRIWRLGDADQDGNFEPTEATQIGSYAPNLCEGSNQQPPALINADKGGAWFDVRVGPASGNVFPIFVSYAPRDHGLTRGTHLALHEMGAGVIALKGEFLARNAGLDDDEVVISWVGKVPAVIPADEELAARLAFDASSGHLVACLGCNGVASYQTSSTDVPPNLLGAWSSPIRSFFHPAFPLGSANFVYVTELSGAVLVFNTASMSGGPVQTVLTRRTATALLAQPTGLPGPRFLLTDGRGGVHELQFLTSP
jgi:hypothetical protein